MAERKFTRGLSKPGSAAQVRETVSQAVRETSAWAKPQLVEPLDYETYIIKNKTIIQNDPQRDILIFPLDDVSQEIIPRTNRTMVSTIPSGMEKGKFSLFVRECIKTYTINFHVVKYKYDAHSGTFLQLARLPKSCDLQDQVYEIDAALGSKDVISLGSSQSAIIKEGYVFKGPESGTDSFLSIATKSFKKRYMSLRKEIDGTHTLEFYKDESKSESKGSFSMEFCNKIVQISKKNKWSFALQMGDSHKSCVLAVENEEELESWISTLTAAISIDKHAIENNKKSQVEVEDMPPIPSPSPTNYGTLKSLEHSKNPELVKYSRETDYSITEARKENRQNIFAIYPDMQVTLQPPSFDYERNVDPPREEFKMRIFVKFEEIKFKLQPPSACDKGSVSQLEPYFTSMTIYDAKEGRKMVEDFKFDINESHICQMLPNRSKILNGQNDVDCRNENESDPLETLSTSVRKDWLSSAKQVLFSVKNPHPDLYLVVRIEKVLQGSICHAAEPYFRPNDTRAAAKVQKLAKLCCQHLSRYRMPFAWAARPIFRPFTKELDVSSEISPIFRHDNSKLGEEDFLKILSDFRKPDKLKHLAIIPGAVKISIFAQTDSIPNTLTTSLVPVMPFPIPPVSEPTFEIQEYLTDVAKENFPFNSYINHLYVCPRSLKYDNQKIFTKARNIACVVEIRESDDAGAQSLQCIYGRPGEPLLVTSASTAVTHHMTCPDFYEEIKVRLPPHLHEKHHLLFTFYHVSCHLPKASKKKEGPVEVVIGYSWLPLLSKGRLNLDEHSLPVSSHLPAGYLSFQPFGLGKGFSGPEIRWVENGKELYKVGLKLISTIYCKDHHLYSFFMLCEKLLEGKSPAPEAEINTSLKALHAVDVSTIINFLPTVVNQLMQLLVCTSSEGIALNTVRVLIHIVNGVHEAEKGNILRCYIQYMFIAENICPHHHNNNTTVHEKLAKYLAITLRPANTDFLVINNFLKHSWFFFQLLTKSMAQHLLSSGRIKMQRHERFPADYQYRIQNLLQVMVSHIFQKYQDIPLEARQANQSLAYFIKKCFTFMDRGFVFKLINFYLEKYCCADDVQILHEYKFEFLEVVSSHEHFIALNLPILHRTIYRGQTKNIKDYEQEYWLSEQFCQHHFLVGVLLQEIKVAMADTHVRKVAISVLCNLLAKHSFDDRYQGRAQQARIASLYLPFIPIIMDNIKLLDTGEIGSPSSHKLNGIDELFSEAMPSTPTHQTTSVPRCNTMTAESLILPTISGRSNRDSSYLTFIAGQGLVSKRSINGSHGSLDSSSSTPSSVSDRGHEYVCNNKDKSEKADKFKVVFNGGHIRSQSFPFGSNTALSRFEKGDSSEIKHLLVCFLYIIKNVSEELIIGWWHHCSESDVLNFFHVLEFCLHQFKYVGKKHIRNQNTKKSTSKAMTLPARTVPLWIPQRGNSTFCETHSVSPTSESDNTYRALLEANMATEVGLIALDVLGQYCFHFKENLLINDGDNSIMQKIFDIYLSFLQVGQSETLLKHLFASLRAFINKFPMALFQGSDVLCGKLCFELLRCCSSKLSTVRNEACALLYLLMRSNFEFTRHKSLTRVHLQLIIAVSQLLGDVVGLNSTQFQESLSIINNYSNSDKAMQHSAFPSQVKDLTKRIRTVLMATVQMKEHENDPEMFIDLQHQLANSYSATPALRKTWLESMARNHIKNGDYSEAAHCFIHIAALQAEYLRQKGLFPKGCQAFRYISPNIEQDESNMKEDCGNQEIQYTEDSLLESLEQCATLLDQAERYEIIAEVYKLIIPVYERRRNYEALTASYKKLYSAFSKVVEVNKTGKRLLGRYYRVAFFGQAYFGDESGKEYIYKEPKVTSLVEVSERLHQLFCEKFGKDVVKMIMDSNQVSSRDLDSKYAYIQVTHVVPYFDEDELRDRVTEFERSNNLRCFMFETPFTKDETKPRGNPDEQLKRQTIVKALYSFPYVKKRIPVFSKTIQVLSPIEVAIDEMNCRVKELQDVISTKPTDLKKLQLKLQGSISVQVNAGPLAYAKAFLDENKVRRYQLDKVLMLKDVYQLFIGACQEALDLNGKLVISDQHEYHSALKVNFQEMVTGLSNYLNNQVFADDSGTFRRTSLEVFSFISGSSTA